MSARSLNRVADPEKILLYRIWIAQPTGILRKSSSENGLKRWHEERSRDSMEWESRGGGEIGPGLMLRLHNKLIAQHLN